MSLSNNKLVININKAICDMMPIAICNLNNNIDSSAIEHIIISDLNGCGRFNIHKSNYKNISKTADAIRAYAIVTYNIVEDGDNFNISINLVEWPSKNVLITKSFFCNRKVYRRIAHNIADVIYHHLTGDPGYFSSKITYVSESGVGSKKTTSIAITDHNGENQQRLTRSGSIFVTPRFSSDGKNIVFLSYHGKRRAALRCTINIMDLSTGAVKAVPIPYHNIYAPRFMDEDKKIIFSISHKTKTIMAIYDIATSTISDIYNKPISKSNQWSPWIDTSASYIAHRQEILFNSDRGGMPQLYTLNVHTKAIKKISQSGRYFAPSISPDGNWIVCVKMYQLEFYLCIINTKTWQEKILANFGRGYVIDSPSWAPDSQHIIFAALDRKGVSKLYIINLHTRRRHTLFTPLNAADPHWSGIL